MDESSVSPGGSSGWAASSICVYALSFGGMSAPNPAVSAASARTAAPQPPSSESHLFVFTAAKVRMERSSQCAVNNRRVVSCCLVACVNGSGGHGGC